MFVDFLRKCEMISYEKNDRMASLRNAERARETGFGAFINAWPHLMFRVKLRAKLRAISVKTQQEQLRVNFRAKFRATFRAISVKTQQEPLRVKFRVEFRVELRAKLRAIFVKTQQEQRGKLPHPTYGQLGNTL